MSDNNRDAILEEPVILETVMIPDGGFNNNDDDTEDTSCLHKCLLRLLCWPTGLVLLVVMVLFVVVFGILPLFLFFVVATCVYYACTKDPLPPGVLWRAMFQDEPEPQFATGSNNNTTTNNNDNHPVPFTKEEIDAKLRVRVVLQVHTVPAKQQEETNEKDTLEEKEKEQSDDDDDDDKSNNHTTEKEHTTTLVHQWKEQGNGELSCTCHNETGEVVEEIQFSKLLRADEPTLHNQDDDTQDAVSRLMCDVCMIEYKVNDVVAWPSNPNCDHIFHKSCITNWLIRSSTCPFCRQEYLLEEETDDVEKGESSSSPSSPTAARE